MKKGKETLKKADKGRKAIYTYLKTERTNENPGVMDKELQFLKLSCRGFRNQIQQLDNKTFPARCKELRNRSFENFDGRSSEVSVLQRRNASAQHIPANLRMRRDPCAFGNQEITLRKLQKSPRLPAGLCCAISFSPYGFGAAMFR